MSKPFYLTTPIYYVNDVPHIGHAYTTIAADVLARYRRLAGDDVFFLTGLDEHGQKVQQAAAKAGIDPQAHCDRLAPQFHNLWKLLHISHDAFIRTTDPGHQAVVQRYLQRLFDKELIYRADYTGWYCTFDERFWTEKDVHDGLCPDCRRPIEKLSESNYFFRMSRFQDRLIDHIHTHPAFIRPETRRNEVLGFLQKPLEDLSISRPKNRLAWGIPLPFDPDYVTYVWFDALVNYLSALEYLTPSPALNRFWPANLHLVGKDILTTHAVYWSTMLMGLDLPLPHTIFAHGWWTVNGEKMSKSRGNVIDPAAIVQDYGVDGFRFFLLREVPFGQDGDFSQSALTERYNSYLANGIGNLFSRTLTLIDKHFSGFVPQPDLPVHKTLEQNIQDQAEQVFSKVGTFLFDPERAPKLEFQPALIAIWDLVTLVDRYLDQTAPWELAKTPDGKPKLKTVLYTASEALRFLSLAIYPFMPSTAQRMRAQLGLPPLPEQGNPVPPLQWNWGQLPEGTKIRKDHPLFPRIGPSRAKAQSDHPKQAQAVARSQEQEKPGQGASISGSRIGITDFQRVDLRVGVVLEAERIHKSTKLLKLQVDLGQERRQIVAGIGMRFEPSELIGRQIVVVANLEPAKLMGVESQGMVLAAGEKEVKGLLTVTDAVPPGTKVR